MLNQSRKSRAMNHRAEIFDQMQELYETTGFNDHQLHCVLSFSAGLDRERLNKAVLLSLEAIPILSSSYVNDEHGPRWESIDVEARENCFERVSARLEFERFVTYRIDETRGPQLKFCFFESSESGGQAIAVTMNHMIGDAAGFKQYLYFLCEIYSRLASDPDFKPARVDENRSMRRVMRCFSPVAKLVSLFSQARENNDPGSNRFPLSSGSETAPFILTRKIERSRFLALKNYGKKRGATLNDVVLTTYFRCLHGILSLPDNAELRLPIMIDMRRYLKKDEAFTALTNLSSTAIIKLAIVEGEGFDESLKKIKSEIHGKKNGHFGLNGFTKLALLYALLPQRAAYRVLEASLRSPLICMTNVGILDPGRLSFGSVKPSDAFMCGSIKHKPHFQMAMSGYQDEFTLSVNLYGDSEDKRIIEGFFDRFERELP